jgi:hypothetical protein
VTNPYEPPPDDGPVDPNPAYAVPPWSGQHLSHSQAPVPPGSPGWYPPPWDSGRPAGLMAATVLAYIDAGLLILAGLLLLVGASAIDEWNNAFGGSGQSITAELTVDGVVNLVSAGLQIAGAVIMAGRNVHGRVVFSAGAGVCVATGIYWVLRRPDSDVLVWAIVLTAMPVIGLVMAWAPQSTAWLRREGSRAGP